MMEETRGGDRSLPLPIASRSGQVALPAPSGFAWPPMFAFMSNPILHHQATPMLPLPVLPLDISQSAYQQTGEMPSSSLRAERRQSAPGMVASTSDSLPVFKATNPSHMSCCAHCKVGRSFVMVLPSAFLLTIYFFVLTVYSDLGVLAPRVDSDSARVIRTRQSLQQMWLAVQARPPS